MKNAYALIACCLCLHTVTSVAAEREGFWAGIDIGVGNLSLEPEVAKSSTGTHLYLGFQGGYTLHPQLQVGIEAGGWNIEAGNIWNPSEGEGLMQLFAVARYWPAAAPKLFVKLGGGSVTHWNNEQGAGKGTGSGYCLGIGYEVAKFAGVESHWFLNYNAGDVTGYTPPGGVRQDEDYSALSTGLTLGF